MTLANATVSSGNATVTTLTAPTHNSASSLTFQTNGTTTAMTISTTGDVLVGQTTAAVETGSIVTAKNLEITKTIDSDGGALGQLSWVNNTNAGSGSGTSFAKDVACIKGIMDGTGNNSGGYITFETKADAGTRAERMRILATGNILSLSGGSTTATGTGIAFPATQSASSDANTLDDYEEGTFTPTIIGKTSAGTGTYSNQTGSYIKVGQIVSIFIRMDWSAHTGTGNMGFGGLPFTSAGTFANGAAVNGMAGMTVTASCYVAANVDASSTTGSFLAIPVGGGNDSPLAMDVSAILLFTITYRASA
jgi:hypothetical protein